MVLLIILIVISAIITVVVFMGADDWDRWFTTTLAFIMSISVSIVILLTVNAAGYEITKTVTPSVHSHSIVSLNDGTGISGTISGGIFITRGQINDTQHFSYYIRNENGSFNLEKRSADQSTIYTDATAETARVDITDTVTTCTPRWWLLCNTEVKKIEFAHADFHVPAGSIINEFELDAR